jgi:phospholipid N-methyltransferase
MPEKPETYADYWDSYVRHFPQRKSAYGEHVEWPGDEWGTPQNWKSLFSDLFLAKIDPAPKTAIEIGPGSGKYTLMFLDAYPSASLVAADVSHAYLKVLEERCAEQIGAGRLATALIGEDHRAITMIAAEHGIGPGELDVLFSIDAMVHVDLQYLVAYWLSAQELLRPGGKLIMTLADATRDGGFAKLMNDVARLFPLQGRASDKFEWLCPQLVESVLGRLGFSVEAERKPARRDYCFVATRRA